MDKREEINELERNIADKESLLNSGTLNFTEQTTCELYLKTWKARLKELKKQKDF